jgi:hypothetical protein
VHPESALARNRPLQDAGGGSRMTESVQQDDELLRRIVQRQQAPWEDSDGVKSAQRRWIAILGFAATSLVAGSLAFLIYQFFGARAPDVSAAANVPSTSALSSSFPKSPGERATVKNAPKLVLSAVSGLASQPVALGVNIDAATPDSSVLIRGLPPGSRVTAGFTTGDGAWRVPMRELPQAAIVPPPDFVGTMQLAVDLRRSDDSVVDTDVQRIIWSAVGPSFAVAAPVKTAMVAAPQDVFPPPPAPRVSAGAPQTIGSGSSSLDDPQRGENARLPGSRRLDPEEVQNLVQRGDAAWKSGDIAAARLLLRRAAEAADMRAAMALAATYDPGVLTQLRAMGANADVGTARQWYQKAAELGSPDARRRLQELGQQ